MTGAGRFGSVVTAMVTPFRDDHAVDLPGAQELASWLVDNGSDAIVVAGSTGESPTLTHKEKAQLFEAVGEAIRGRAKLICGTGTYSTAETLELTQAAEDAGADGLLVVTPYYNKPPQRGLVAHFEHIADATELPMILYNIPGRTAIRIEHGTLLQLAQRPNIVAVKDSTGDFQAVSRVIAEAPDGFEVYSGDDWATFGYVCLGAVGIVSVASHLVGPQIRQMVDLIATGDVPAARRVTKPSRRSTTPCSSRPTRSRSKPPWRCSAVRRVRRVCRWSPPPRRRRSGCARHWRKPVSSDTGSVRVVFLGGVGEVGRNMACIEVGDRILIVDVGLSFPSGDMPGIDLVLPDFDYIRGNLDRVEAVVLTHGHEDHIGALPYLLRETGHLPIYGTPFTLALLEGKLEEHQVADRATLNVVNPGETSTVGPFTMRYLRVTHSIPDGMAVAIDTPYGTLLHTGDFKIDQTPLDGRATDLHGLAEEASGTGVHLLLSDSTNAEEAGYTSSERSVGPVLERIVANAPEIVVAACFSSHIHRIQQIVNAAVADERVVAFLGRSMHTSVRAARRLGLLRIDDRDVVDIEQVATIDPGRVVVICTGSQGEPYSALSLMAQRQHKWVKLQERDTVVLSSSLIPGNEPAIHRVVDALYRTGADVYHMPADPVHASGHAAAEELRLMLSLVRPRWFIPVHGERRHLQHHARLAEEVGIPHDHVIICEDGDVVDVGEQVEIVDRVQAGMTFVDGLGIGDVGGEVLRDRRKLAGDGVVVVVVTVDSQTGELVGGPDIVNRGFVYEEASQDILDEARDRVVASIGEAAHGQGVDPSALQQDIRRVLGRYFNEVTQRKPVILPVVMEA